MAKNSNTYDAARDHVIGPVLLVHLNTVNGERMGGFGEGVSSFAICCRQMDQLNEDGTVKPGERRVAICQAYVAKKAGTEKFQRYVIGANGRAALGVAAEGSIVLGSAIGRLSPVLTAHLYPTVAQFAQRVLDAASKKTAKAA